MGRLVHRDNEVFGSYTSVFFFSSFREKSKRRRPLERWEAHVDETVYFHPILSISSKFYVFLGGVVGGNFIHGTRNEYFVSNFRFPILVVFV